jgi:hypothetical protein
MNTAMIVYLADRQELEQNRKYWKISVFLGYHFRIKDGELVVCMSVRLRTVWIYPYLLLTLTKTRSGTALTFP